MARNKDTRVIEIVANGTKASDSIKQLSAAARKLRSDLRTLDPASKEFADGTKRLAEVNKRLNTLTGSLRNSASAWDRFKREAKTVFTGVLAANVFQGVQSMIANFFNSATDGAYKLSDALADVRKTTGMLQGEVELLYADLGSIDTRTSRMELLELARDAGKLGIEGRQNIIEFVDAADKINVALGEDLGEDAIKNIAKLNTLLGVSEKYGYGEAMLRTGSALNYLGAKSVAAEGFMVQLAKRLGGVAELADMTMPQVLGIASAMDNLGAASEMSGTAIQKTLIAVATESEKAAQIAGVPVKEFKKMVDEDINSAFIAFLKGVNGSGGLAAIKGNLDQMGLSSERVTQVIGSLASQTAMLAREQEKANKSFDENTSILEEFDIKNNTTAARAKKAWKKLYGQFKPLQQKLGNATASTIEWIADNLGAITKFIRLMIAATATLVTYKAMVALSTLIEKAHNNGLKLRNYLMKESIVLTKAQAIKEAALNLVRSVATLNIQNMKAAYSALAKTMKLTPWGLAITAIAATATAYIALRKRVEEVDVAKKALNDARIEADKSIVKEMNSLRTYLDIARDEKVSKEKRQEAIEALNELSPEYLGNLTLENSKTEDVTESVNKYIEALRKKAIIQATEEKRAELYGKLLDAGKKDLDEYLNGFEKGMKFIFGKSAGLASHMAALSKKSSITKQIQEEMKALDELQKKYYLMDKIVGDDKKTKKPKPLTPEEIKKLVDNTRKLNDQLIKLKIESIEEEEKRELAMLLFKHEKRQEEIEGTMASEKVKNSLLRAEELDYLRRKHELSMEYAEKRNKEEFDQSLKNLQNHQKRELLQESMRHANGETSAEEYEANMTALKIRHLEERTVLYEDYSKDTTEIEQQITDAVIANNQARMQSDQEAFDHAYNLERARLEMKLQIFEEGSEAWLAANQDLLDLEAEQMRQHLEELGLAGEEIDKYFEERKAQRQRENRQRQWEEASELAQQTMNAALDAHQTKLNIEAKKDDVQRKKELAKLDALLKQETITENEYREEKERIEQQYEEKDRIRKRKAWEAQKAADMATAVIQGVLAVMKVAPDPIRMTLAGIVSAINVAKIASTPSPQFEQGTVLRGPSHAGGGIDIYGKDGTFYGNAEGDEIILNKKVYRSPVGRKMASDLNQAFGGIRFDGFSSTAPPQFSLGGVAKQGAGSTQMAQDLKSFEANVIRYLAMIHAELGKPAEAFFTYDTWKNAQEDVQDLENGGRL